METKSKLDIFLINWEKKYTRRKKLEKITNNIKNNKV